jgi:hypothetical protein
MDHNKRIGIIERMRRIWTVSRFGCRLCEVSRRRGRNEGGLIDCTGRIQLSDNGVFRGWDLCLAFHLLELVLQLLVGVSEETDRWLLPFPFPVPGLSSSKSLLSHVPQVDAVTRGPGNGSLPSFG